VKTLLWMASSALALAILSAPVAAQQATMPGMAMPMPAKTSPAKKSSAKRPPAKKAPAKSKQAVNKAPTRPPSTAKKAVGAAQSEPGPTPQQTMPGMTMPGGEPQLSPSKPAMDQSAAGPMAGMDMKPAGRMDQMAMTGALGTYPMERESSGTAWQPDTSEPMGLMGMRGGWTFMAHGVLNLVYDRQSGPRGDDKEFASGMLMGMARHSIGNGTLQLKAMVSPDPLMGPRGYPLLLASGETANGRDRLIDRQHPHDLFMELSASVSQNIGPKSSLFLYAGLPGEPAFGPPSFMHRESIMDSPEAPISHHWLDSTHISFGVATGGIVLDRVKLEISRFNGREPDQHRWNIETGPLDSTSLRLSWNPTAQLALQASWGHFIEPEQLEPGVDQKRLSASVLYAREVAPGWKVAGTLAWGRKTVEHHKDDALAAEASIKHAGWTLFGRGEIAENRELVDVQTGPAFRVGKVSVGAVRDFRIADHLTLGAGGLFAVNFVPNSLAPLYGGKTPIGTMGFVRLKLN
jgi:hypothetical protein